jgi:hypothetical protein
MAKFQIKAMLLVPSADGYTQETDPKAYGDFKILETAYEHNNLDVMEFVLNNYRYEDGAVEEHKNDAKTIIEYSGDGFCLLERIG